MKCPMCGLSLPEDSEFCQYCGANVRGVPIEVAPMPPESPKAGAGEAPEAVSVQMPTEQQLKRDAYVAVGDTFRSDAAVSQREEKSEISAPVEYTEGPKTNLPGHGRARYCKRCGSLVDPGTKKCCGCGKQYFRPKTGVPIIILTVICVASLSFNVAQFIWGKGQADALAETKDQMEVLQKDLLSLRRDFTSRDKEVGSQALQIASLRRKLSFYEDCACCVNKGSKKYHIYGCEDFDTSSSFWIYNIEAAKGYGYTACPKCYD